MGTPSPIPIFDGHNDTLLQLHLQEPPNRRSFFERSQEGHIDLPRAREGGLGGGFFALFTPSPRSNDGLPATHNPAGAPEPQPVDQPHALAFTMALAARLFRLEEEAQGQAQVVRTVDELVQALEDGVLAMIFHIEGAEAIDTQLDSLEVFYRAGLRSLGITWSRPNAFGTGVPFRFPSSPDIGPGLTEAGRALVQACNRLGILIDLSHLNEKGFWDVAALSNAPLVATHSGAHALAPSSRNLTDRQLDAIRDSGGVVGVNFHVGFLREDGQVDANTPLDRIVDHLDYMVQRMGVAHVAFGSDFDGATMPAELKDVAGLPRLMERLRARGYGDAELRQIAYENWVRVLRATWR
ncbi:MAG: membrane dipeptidase [Litorilinea sp.]|nr:MAG: membrane dipeptidase [Litorilinea sp.]